MAAGRTMISVPANPTTTALQRRAPIRSPKNTTAPIEPKMTTVKLSAVACAIGTTLSA